MAKDKMAGWTPRATSRKRTVKPKPTGVVVELERLGKKQTWTMKMPATIDRPTQAAYELGFRSRCQDWFQEHAETDLGAAAKRLYREHARRDAFITGYKAARAQELQQ